MRINNLLIFKSILALQSTVFIVNGAPVSHGSRSSSSSIAMSGHDYTSAYRPYASSPISFNSRYEYVNDDFGDYAGSNLFKMHGYGSSSDSDDEFEEGKKRGYYTDYVDVCDERIPNEALSRRQKISNLETIPEGDEDLVEDDEEPKQVLKTDEQQDQPKEDSANEESEKEQGLSETDQPQDDKSDGKSEKEQGSSESEDIHPAMDEDDEGQVLETDEQLDQSQEDSSNEESEKEQGSSETDGLQFPMDEDDEQNISSTTQSQAYLPSTPSTKPSQDDSETPNSVARRRKRTDDEKSPTRESVPSGSSPMSPEHKFARFPHS